MTKNNDTHRAVWSDPDDEVGYDRARTAQWR